jgi:DnaK suppressor protein
LPRGSKVETEQPVAKAEAKSRRSGTATKKRSSGAKKAATKTAATKTASKPASSAKATSAKATSAKATKAAREGKGKQVPDKFLQEQKALLEAERATYEAQAAALKAEADELAQEMEPGDIQFDEESGEGGTGNVDRERDLALSAQARVAVEEIDHALQKIAGKSYGSCEKCGQPIPRPRLKALPYARLCVACKSGGLSRR